jgi:hypothetical protein
MAFSEVIGGIGDAAPVKLKMFRCQGWSKIRVIQNVEKPSAKLNMKRSRSS